MTRTDRNRVPTLCAEPWIVKVCDSCKHNPSNHEPDAWAPVMIQPHANHNGQCSHYCGMTHKAKK